MKAQFVKFYMKFLLLASALRLFATFDLTILHTNDVHARIGQFNAFGSDCRPQDADAGACFGGEARRLTKVKEIRSQPDLMYYFWTEGTGLSARYGLPSSKE